MAPDQADSGSKGASAQVRAATSGASETAASKGLTATNAAAATAPTRAPAVAALPAWFGPSRGCCTNASVKTEAAKTSSRRNAARAMVASPIACGPISRPTSSMDSMAKEAAVADSANTQLGERPCGNLSAKPLVPRWPPPAEPRRLCRCCGAN
jgi:hypothetical protein